LVGLGERLLPIEVKSGQTVHPEAVATMRWWLDLPGNANIEGVLVHGGERSFSLHGIQVRPWWLGESGADT
jgi:hypothetical protein